ncbi:hypothetical protein Tco_1027689 [Tanacetum coccineum]
MKVGVAIWKVERAGLWGAVEGALGRRGLWRDIAKIEEDLEGIGIDFTSSFRGVVGDGNDIGFWVDRWVDDSRLCDRFNRLYHLDMRKEERVVDKGSWVNNEWQWKWKWDWDWGRSLSGRGSMEMDATTGLRFYGQGVNKISGGKSIAGGEWESRNIMEQLAS